MDCNCWRGLRYHRERAGRDRVLLVRRERTARIPMIESNSAEEVEVRKLKASQARERHERMGYVPVLMFLPAIVIVCLLLSSAIVQKNVASRSSRRAEEVGSKMAARCQHGREQYFSEPLSSIARAASHLQLGSRIESICEMRGNQ